MIVEMIVLTIAWAIFGVSVGVAVSMLRTLRDEAREAFRGIRVVWPWSTR
jgi:hypothetical protein